MNPLRIPGACYTVWRTFGVSGAGYRLVHEIRRRLNLFADAPRNEAPAPTGRLECLVVDAAALAAATDRQLAIERADRVVQGQYQAFRNRWIPLPSTASDWHRLPDGGYSFDGDVQWWKVAHMGSGGDIKKIWEPARFAWVYDLVRGYLLTQDKKYRDAFESIFESWREANPPFRGVHWSCGQETSIRATALLFAEANLDLTETGAQRVARTLRDSGERVRDAIGYAISQNNNHGISESVGLLLLGTRFTGAVPGGRKWVQTGQRLLERLIQRQFASDGWYTQHSFNYTRLALEQCVLAERVLKANGSALSGPARDRIAASFKMLLDLMDPETGGVPNYGQNDGAYVLPVTLGTYSDFRPLTEEIAAVFGFSVPEAIPLGREASAWLGGRHVARSSDKMPDFARGNSGWVSVRKGSFHVFVRAGLYRSRPGHNDALQVDIRYGGRPVVCDPGTYSYNEAPPWNNGLASATVHNTPIVDGSSPGVRGPRFLWYRWPHSRVVSVVETDDSIAIETEIPGIASRRVEVSGRRVRITDQTLRETASDLATTWLLGEGVADLSYSVSGAEFRLLHGAEGDTRGWYSGCYDERVSASYIEVRRSAGRADPVVIEFSIKNADV